MGSQDVIFGARVAHMRELKTALEKANAEIQRLRGENAALLAHFDMALVAGVDFRSLPEGGKMVVVDGWNQVLGAGKTARDRAELEAQWREYLEAHPLDFVWIVYDGSRAGSTCEGRLRISYTGGEGPQRADRFICDFARMALWLGHPDRLEVRTGDKALAKSVAKALARKHP